MNPFFGGGKLVIPARSLEAKKLVHVCSLPRLGGLGIFVLSWCREVLHVSICQPVSAVNNFFIVTFLILVVCRRGAMVSHRVGCQRRRATPTCGPVQWLHDALQMHQFRPTEAKTSPTLISILCHTFPGPNPRKRRKEA